MANTKVTQHVIADDAITTSMITDANVTPAKLHGTLDLSSKTLTLPSAAVATTQSASDNSTKLATTAYVTTALANLVDSSPSDLNTLNELAAALNDDASFSSTVTTSIAAKLPLAGGTMTGDLILGDNVKIEVGSASGGDLQIYHNGSHSFIDEQGTGGLIVRTGDFYVRNPSDADMIYATSGGAVKLYHNNSEKLETTSYGVSASGTGALKIPVGTTGQRPTAATGQLRFNSTEAKIEVYNGSAWVAVGAGASNKVLDTYTGDGSTTAFTLSVTPANEDALMVFIDGVYQEKGDYVLNNAILTLDTAPASGEKVAVHTTTASVHDGTSAVNQQFTGDGSTTDFTLSQDPKSENNTQVYINGVYQQKTDYTVSGTTLTFDTAPTSGDIIEVNMFTVATLGNSDTVTEGVSNLYHTSARTISALSGATLTGNLTIQNASSPTLKLVDTTQSSDLRLFAQDSNVGIGTFSNHAVRFYTNSTSRLAITNAGNVGVGTDNPGSKLTVEGDIRQTTGDLLYQGGGNWDIKHLGDDQNILFYTSQSGSASEKLRIKANGQVKIGNTSGGGILNVDNGTTDGGYVHFANNVGSTTLTNDKGLAFGWNKSNGQGESVIIANQGAGSAGGLVFATNTSGGSYAERMRILANGRVGIGTDSPATNLHVNTTASESVVNFDCTQRYCQVDWKQNNVQKGAIWTDATDENFTMYTPSGFDLDFWAGATRRMRIDSDGYLHAYNLYGSTASQNDVRYNPTSGLIFYNTSSRRYKENIQDIPDGILTKINQARPVTFDEIGTDVQSFGLIAEELDELIPELVTRKEVDGAIVPDGITYSMLSVYLLKAIQEQQTIIEDLKSRIETLEG